MRLSALPVRGGEVFPVPGAMVAVGSSSTVVIADPSDEPGVSGVWNDQEFRLVGPAPAPVASRLVGPMPFTAAGTPPEPLVHLFVRLDGGCLCLGTGRGSMCEGERGRTDPLPTADLPTAEP
ncbi:hypothetical protein [Streptomyces atratus]|uniref:hypothetical protein n=1 Tax=Streptomyces atratus TaxID=1893 RepID=UPI0022524BD7|nr:hypothetical protein [Streptomyces atratus]MCX5345939.1 hypothetical protein [Streptomyces atratus]